MYITQEELAKRIFLQCSDWVMEPQWCIGGFEGEFGWLRLSFGPTREYDVDFSLYIHNRKELEKLVYETLENFPKLTVELRKAKDFLSRPPDTNSKR